MIGGTIIPQLAASPNRAVGQLDPEANERLHNEVALICSISPWSPYNINENAGWVDIPGKPEDAEYILIPIHGYVSYKSFGFDQFEPVLTSAKVRAKDIVDRINSKGNPGGVFIPKAEDGTPTKQELADAKERFETYGRYIIGETEKDWPRHKNPRMVSDHARWFAAHLGMKADWLGQTIAKAECEACRGRLEPTAVRCPSCRHVVDWQRAYDMLALTPDEEERAMDRGLIRPIAKKAKG